MGRIFTEIKIIIFYLLNLILNLIFLINSQTKKKNGMRIIICLNKKD